jgi:SAM-dependent methyltransferase
MPERSTSMAADRPPLRPEDFDQAFSMTRSERLARLMGNGLPDDVDPYSFVTGDGLHVLAERLSMCRSRTILDLACGQGGPGLWLARTIGADLVGVDFSRVGIQQARRRAERAGFVAARYLVADAAATGLRDATAAGVVSIDSIQLIRHQRAVMDEVVRVLEPGGRAVFTTWEHPARLPDLRALFEAAGLDAIDIVDQPDWLAREVRIFERAVAESSIYPDDSGLEDLAAEARVALPQMQESRRVLGIAQRP